MDSAMERESGALGGLFQQIIQDMKVIFPLRLLCIQNRSGLTYEYKYLL